jgi:hypothetical protein
MNISPLMSGFSVKAMMSNSVLFCNLKPCLFRYLHFLRNTKTIKPHMHCFHQESANEKKCCHQHATQMRQNEEWKTHFWTDKIVWRRSAINTLRCLTGCSIGDLSTMFYLSTFFSSMPTWAIMSLSMSAGIGTSLALETVALRITDKLSWKESFNLAWTMSLMSMLVMELTENIVDRSLTGGVVHLSDPYFWFAMLVSLIAAFTVPLPYNYYKLKKYGVSCH